jgi:hypothetical protein
MSAIWNSAKYLKQEKVNNHSTYSFLREKRHKKKTVEQYILNNLKKYEKVKLCTTPEQIPL